MMKVLYIYRHPDMGYSIGRVFEPIEKEMRKYCECDKFYIPRVGYKPITLIRNIIDVRYVLQKKEYDIVHIVGSEHYLVPFIKNGKHKVILTVHDINKDQLVNLTIRSLWRKLLWVKIIKYADFVTFVSSQTEKETLEYNKISPQKYCVIPNPIRSEFVYNKHKLNRDCPIILHIGLSRRKNLQGTIQALKGFKCKLHLIGKMTDEYLFLLNTNDIDYSHDCNLSDEEIVKEYEKCDIVDFPSLYEGFGMPIIEAQAIGRPVVTSNLQPMKDVAGKGAVIVDPTDPSSIKAGYQIAIDKYDEIVLSGLENVKRFSVETIAKNHYANYHKLMKK